jgi:biopolymer transport protein ExbB
MTALGLVVAVPAVLAYNWLIRRNKSIMEDLTAFTNDVHGYIMSNGQVKPVLAAPTKTAPTAAPKPGTTTGGTPVQPTTRS